jgi:hypothetical protein
MTPLGNAAGSVLSALLTVSKKMDIRSAHARADSRRHVFETNVNWFAPFLQSHSTKPLDNLTQQASIGKGYTGRIDPVDDLRRRLHAGAAAFKKQPQDLLQTKSIFSVVREDDSVFARGPLSYDGKDALN